MSLDDDIYRIVEELNSDYLSVVSSKEYRTGYSLLMMKKLLKQGRISEVITKIRYSLSQKKVGNFPDDDSKVDMQDLSNKNHVVIYTCVTGGYDAPLDPFIAEKNVDYIFYSDGTIDSGSLKKWRTNPLPYFAHEYGECAIKNRYVKMHPFELFSKQYDFAIYIDGNIRPYSDVSSYAALAKRSIAGIAMHRHACRTCIYEEVDFCIKSNKGNKRLMNRQIHQYKDEGMPRNYGLLEAPLIVTDLNNAVAHEFYKSWWEEFICSGSGRDQLSIPYVLWKMGLSVSDVGCIGNDISTNSKVRKLAHNKDL